MSLDMTTSGEDAVHCLDMCCSQDTKTMWPLSYYLIVYYPPRLKNERTNQCSGREICFASQSAPQKMACPGKCISFHLSTDQTKLFFNPKYTDKKCQKMNRSCAKDSSQKYFWVLLPTGLGRNRTARASCWLAVVERPLLWQTPYLFGDIEVEDHHAEIVDYKGLPKDEWLPVLHVSRSRPQEEQVQAADGQSGEGRWHHWPFFDPFVWRRERWGYSVSTSSVCAIVCMCPIWSKGYGESLLVFYRL